jgi:hypothetical protein
MSLTDYIISLLLISVVIRQMRGRRLTLYSLVWPVLLVLVIGTANFKGVPTQANDIPFIVLAGTLGATLGIVCGLLTKVSENKKGILVAKATSLAAVVWIIGTGLRLVFALYATHGGGANIERFSVRYHLTNMNAWICALLFMALAEVLGRTVTLAVRALNYKRGAPKQKSVSQKTASVAI